MPKYGAHPGYLAEHVDAKAPAFLGDIGEVEVVPGAKALDLLRRENFPHIALEFRVRQLAELDGQQVAVHAQHRRHPHGEVHVRAALCQAQLQKCVDSRHIPLFIR